MQRSYWNYVKSSSDGDVRHSLIPEVYQTINSITFPIPLTLFRKVKFLSKKNPNIFTSFLPNFFWQFFSWNQSCQQLKSPKPLHFHEFSPKKLAIFSGDQSWIFGQKMKISNSVLFIFLWYGEMKYTVCCKVSTYTLLSCFSEWILNMKEEGQGNGAKKSGGKIITFFLILLRSLLKNVMNAEQKIIIIRRTRRRLGWPEF